jgi:hypothetical protein
VSRVVTAAALAAGCNGSMARSGILYTTTTPPDLIEGVRAFMPARLIPEQDNLPNDLIHLPSELPSSGRSLI